MFPIITSIEEFRSHTSHKQEIREADIGHGFKSFCYMIAAEGTFETDWLRVASSSMKPDKLLPAPFTSFSTSASVLQHMLKTWTGLKSSA